MLHVPNKLKISNIYLCILKDRDIMAYIQRVKMV
jgi:hypothetical protein